MGRGGSSSSSDSVRSITSGAGRLFDDLGAADVSREAALVGVARCDVDAEAMLAAAVLLTGIVVTCETIMSSSSTKLALWLELVCFFAPGTAHSPFGSMVTCSTESEVWVRICRAYLCRLG